MPRLVTAPAVGVLIGAVEGGIVFLVLTIIYVDQASKVRIDNGRIYEAAIYGTIFGSFAGALIGLIVALKEVRGRAEFRVKPSQFGCNRAVFALLVTQDLREFASRQRLVKCAPVSRSREG